MAFLVPMCFWRRAEAHDYNGKASRKRAAAGWWRGGMAGGVEGTASQVSLFSYSFLALLSSGIILFASGTSFIKGAPPFSGDGGGPLGPSPDDRPTDEPRLILLLDPAPLAASANPKLVAMIITQAGGGEGGGIEARRLVGGGRGGQTGARLQGCRLFQNILFRSQSLGGSYLDSTSTNVDHKVYRLSPFRCFGSYTYGEK